MEPEKDAYGEIIKDIHTGDNPTAGEIFERDDGYVNYTGSADYLFEPYEEWSEQVQNGIDHAKQNAIDIGCGAGRHALHMQEQGVEVVGVDVSPKSVEVAKERGVRRVHTVGIDGIKQNTTKLGGPWDTVLLLGNNLGLLGTCPVSRLRDLADVTTDDAVLIGQTRAATEVDKQQHTSYHEYNRARGRKPGCLKMRVRYKHYRTDWFNYLMVDKDELKEILNDTPWNLCCSYHGEDSVYTVLLEK